MKHNITISFNSLSYFESIFITTYDLISAIEANNHQKALKLTSYLIRQAISHPIHMFIPGFIRKSTQLKLDIIYNLNSSIVHLKDKVLDILEHIKNFMFEHKDLLITSDVEVFDVEQTEEW